MKCIFTIADDYIRQSDWKDLALIKFCLCAMGILLGLAVPKRGRRMAGVLAVFVFVGTYVPLMIKLFGVAKECSAQCIDIDVDSD